MRKLFFQGWFLAAMFVSLSVGPVLAGEFTGRVVWVYDGDSIKVQSRGKMVRVRLFGIDCPEKGQPYADRALDLTVSLAKGREVTVRVKDHDKYGRVVGLVRLPDGRSLNHELVRSGLAWWYRRYSSDQDLARLEAGARTARQGLWRDSRPVAPWVFKMMKP